MLLNPAWVIRCAALAACLTGLQPFARAQHAGHSPSTGGTALADKPGVHGMLLFGDAQLYASHLPMYHSPHDYQVVLELELSDSARAVYNQSRRDHPSETVYTLDPEKFVLPEMVASPRPFHADLYRGHFERGGSRIARAVQVRIRRVLYFQRLDPAAVRPPHLRYLAVGNAQEQYLLHQLGPRPDYDHVLRVSGSRPLRRALMHSKGAVQWEPTTAPGEKPPTAGAALQGRLPHGRPQALHIDKSLYLEYDDLR